MSRTKKRSSGLSNPVKKIINYKPNSGTFVVYNKETKKKEELEQIDLIILDADRFSLSGYSPEYDAGYVSNLVFNTKKEELVIGVISNGKYKQVTKGFYQDIKEDLEGANYTKNVLALMENEDGKYDLVGLQLVGSARQAFSEWFKSNESEAYDSVTTFSASADVFNYNKKSGEFEVVPKSKQSKWRTTWLRQLELDMVEATEEAINSAIKADEELQNYFDELAGKSSDVSPESSSDDTDNDTEDEDDDLPF